MGMGAMLSGALGVPLTAILFSLELTHALPALLPLVAGLHGRVSRDLAGHAAIHPDGKTRPPRLSPLARVRRRPAGNDPSPK